jgi:hypothetical protein
MTAQRWQIPLCLSLLLVSTIAVAGEAIMPVETPVAALRPVAEAPSPPAARRTIDAATARTLWNDPAIRNFIGLSENAHDFTDPNAIAGFGTLGPADQTNAKWCAAAKTGREKEKRTMPIFHGHAAPSRRQRVLRVAELVMMTCTALLITVVTAIVLLRAEIYLSGLTRISNGTFTAVRPD